MKSGLAIATALTVVASSVAAAPKVCSECVSANMTRLAGAEMRGRACGSAEENDAARFLAQRLEAYGVKGAAPGGGWLQPFRYRVETYGAAPVLRVGDLSLAHGGEIVALQPPPQVRGELARVGLADTAAAAGKVALYDAPYDPKAVAAFVHAGALAVIVPAPDRVLGAWGQLAARAPSEPKIEGVEEAKSPTAAPLVFARAEAIAALRELEGRQAVLSAPRAETALRTSHNVLGVIRGAAPDADRRSILLSAHYDHVGAHEGVVYPGANDDASGTAAVLEFARMLAAGKAPKRTVWFALFGCEEEGGHGAKYFLAHPPTPLADMAANLEFEMIGVPDPQDPKALMLTGWERSNFGPALRARGAWVRPDRYPEEKFFERSDNYLLAKRGVVAQTISAWPIPPTYHQPTDDLAHLDLPFMIKVIQSLAGPIRWLVNSDFRPEWNPGQMP